MIKLHVLYFASLGESLGIREENLTINQEKATVNDVKKLLAARNTLWEKSICGENQLLCAVNQAIANTTNELNNGDELAFFPPVTGG